MKIQNYRKEILNKKIEELREKYGEINEESLQRIGRDYGFSEFIHVPYLRLWGAVGESEEGNPVVLYTGILSLAKNLDLAHQLAPTILQEEQTYLKQGECKTEQDYFVQKLLGTNTIKSRLVMQVDEFPLLTKYMCYPLIKATLSLPFGTKGKKEKFKSKENRIKELGLEQLINEEVMPE